VYACGASILLRGRQPVDQLPGLASQFCGLGDDLTGQACRLVSGLCRQIAQLGFRLIADRCAVVGGCPVRVGQAVSRCRLAARGMRPRDDCCVMVLMPRCGMVLMPRFWWSRGPILLVRHHCSPCILKFGTLATRHDDPALDMGVMRE